MPGLKIYDFEKGNRLCIVSDVRMLDGHKRHYAEMGRNALAHIMERIQLDIAFFKSLPMAQAKRNAACQ